MKQVLQSLRSGELAVEEVPEPACLAGCVLVRNAFSFVSPGTERAAREMAKSSLISKARQRPDQVRKVVEKVRTEGIASTFQKVRARLEEPSPLGYSCAGEVIEVGEGVDGIYPGSRVACAGAGYANHADIVCVPKNLVAPIPDSVPYEDASAATLCAIAMQGLRVGRVQLGEVVGVIGLGLVGQLSVQLLKASGCQVLGVDLDQEAVNKALEMGADQALLRDGPVEETALSMSSGHGLDAVLLCAATDSNDPVELAGILARRKGRVVAVGVLPLNIPRRTYYPKELELLLSTSYGPGRYDPEYEERGRDYPYSYVRFTEQRNMAATLALMAEGKLRIPPLVTKSFPIEKAVDAYSLVEANSGERSFGILLDYDLAEGDKATEPTQRSGQAAPKPTEGKIGVGLIGAGNFGASVLLPKICENSDVCLTHLVTSRGANATSVAKRFGIPGFSTDVKDVLNNPDIAAVVISSPHDQHASQSVAALRAGKHVFVEKPLAINSEDLEEVKEAARETGNFLMVGFNRRFAPLAEKAKQWFEPRNWPLSIVARINAGRLTEGSWMLDKERSGGRIIGEVCHFIDLFQYWTGAEVESVKAECLKPSNATAGGDENVTIALGFSDGSQASLVYLSEGAAGLPKELYEIHGGGRSAILDDFRRLDMYEGSNQSSSKSRTQDKGHKNELDHFFQCIQDGTLPDLSFESCVHTTEVTFEICEKLRKG